ILMPRTGKDSHVPLAEASSPRVPLLIFATSLIIVLAGLLLMLPLIAAAHLNRERWQAQRSGGQPTRRRWLPYLRVLWPRAPHVVSTLLIEANVLAFMALFVARPDTALNPSASGLLAAGGIIR